MKRSILLAALTLFVAVNASAQRKVLIEEFTSSTCGPCAGTDPLMEEFEAEYHDKIVVLKYHQNYPTAGDIMYDAFPPGFDRGNLYAVHQTGIPWVQFNGVTNKNPGYGLDTLKSITDRVMDLSSVYYNISVTQQVTNDSIIATVTVNSGAEVDQDARLVVVVAEANVLHQGSNGRIYHTAAVRDAMSGWDENGRPDGTALSLAANGQGTFRFSRPLKSAWNKGLLQVVAFIQNPDNGMVEGVETTKPDIILERHGGSASVVGSNNVQAVWTVRNAGSTSQSIKLSTQLTKTNPYSITLRDENGNPLGSTFTLAPGESKDVRISIATSGANTEVQNYAISLATSDDIGIIGGGGMAWPGEKKDIFVNAGLANFQETAAGANRYAQAITAAGMPITSIGYSLLLDGFSDLTAFKNIFWASGYTVGIYTGTGSPSQSDTHRIRQFIANGGNIAFSSMQMAAIYHQAGLGDYVEEIFGVSGASAQNGEWTQLTGVAGDPLGNGIDTEIDNILVTQPLDISDLNSTTKGAFTNENDEIVGVHTEHTSGGKAVYMSFEPGNISSTTNRRALVKNIVDWFNGVQGSVNPTSEKNGIVLKQNHPNPFNPGTTIGFELPESGRVTLKVQDMMGREVATVLDNEFRTAGENVAHFDASDLASGNYIYVLTVNGQRLERKMTLAK